MFTMAARTLGYHVTVVDPDREAPAAEFATRHLATAYTDAEALEELARTCAAVTTEFENAPAAALDALSHRTVVRPGGARRISTRRTDSPPVPSRSSSPKRTSRRRCAR
jgi:5-(carboxyamino)imidazole ribonucleotide synthase